MNNFRKSLRLAEKANHYFFTHSGKNHKSEDADVFKFALYEEIKHRKQKNGKTCNKKSPTTIRIKFSK